MDKLRTARLFLAPCPNLTPVSDLQRPAINFVSAVNGADMAMENGRGEYSRIYMYI